MNDCNKTNDGNLGNTSNPDVELFMTIIVNIGNVLSMVYNLPQMWMTYKLKKADDISSYFLWMRLLTGIIWSTYCIYYRMWYVIISWATTIISTMQILYYKYYPSPLAQRRLVEEEEHAGRQESQESRQEQVFEMSEKNNIDIYFYQNGIVQLN